MQVIIEVNEKDLGLTEDQVRKAVFQGTGYGLILILNEPLFRIKPDGYRDQARENYLRIKSAVRLP